MLRHVAYRPGRSILCIALIASATFVIVSLDAFRRDGSPAGTGGFPMLADSVLPLIHDPNSAAGRSALNLPPLDGVQFVLFRLRPGDDTSCLNLYQPRRPRILAPPATFLRSARFAFQDAEGQVRNPWLLLERQPAGGAIPAIADANSMTYVLHRKLGEAFDLDGVRFRIVAALEDSVFQGELIVSEENFLRLFPDTAGYRFFLVNAPRGKEDETTRQLEDSLSDYGFDVQSAPERLAAFHRVENSYLDTFRALGSLGLLLGTVGLGAVARWPWPWITRSTRKPPWPMKSSWPTSATACAPCLRSTMPWWAAWRPASCFRPSPRHCAAVSAWTTPAC